MPSLVRTRCHAVHGFTLVEVLVVMVILAILMAVAIPTFAKQKERAMISATKQQMQRINRIAFETKSTTGLPLQSVTKNWCSDCNCRTVELGKTTDPVFLATPCGQSWVQMVTGFEPYVGSSGEARALFTDAWGRPIVLDENEGESQFLPNCPTDTLSSIGAKSSATDVLSTSSSRITLALKNGGLC